MRRPPPPGSRVLPLRAPPRWDRLPGSPYHPYGNLLVTGRIGFFRAGRVDREQTSEDLGKWHLHGPSDDLIEGPSLRVTRLPYGGSTASVLLTPIAGEKICRTGEKICRTGERICPNIRSDRSNPAQSNPIRSDPVRPILLSLGVGVGLVAEPLQGRRVTRREGPPMRSSDGPCKCHLPRSSLVCSRSTLPARKNPIRPVTSKLPYG